MDLVPLFENTAEQQWFGAGNTIFNLGDAGDSMFVVLQGEVEMWVQDRVVCRAGPGEFFGEMVLIDQSNRHATAIASRDCLLATVSASRFRVLLEQAPGFSLHVMRVLADRLRRSSGDSRAA